jgi:hypothetical protein
MIPKKIWAASLIIFISLLLSGCTTNEIKNNNSNDVDWLPNHLPVHSFGGNSNDFWIEYPENHIKSSESFTHLSWVNDSLEQGCMLFVVHKTGCVSCQPQADRVISLAESYKEHIVFHDLDITLGGLLEERAYDSYLYDPDGPPGYIALTGIFTLINNSGNIEFGWHSWERDVNYKVMEEWLKDGIYYWNQNKGE